MDKKSQAIIIFLIAISIFTNTIYLQSRSSNVSTDTEAASYKEKLIRFHVLANSDSKDDQDLKLKVRDEVIKSMSDKFKDTESIEASRTVVKENMEMMKDIAREVIKNEGKDYAVDIKLEPHNFPTKTYGNFTLPAGEYEAVRVLIGEAKGANWWCVMFPPLCFIDSNTAVVDNETDAEMRKHLTQEEYNEISTREEKMVLKSKLVETIKNWM